jgi:hypothetical protein
MKRAFIRKLYFTSDELVKIKPEHSVAVTKLSCAPSESRALRQEYNSTVYIALRQTGVASQASLGSSTSAANLGKTHALIKYSLYLMSSYFYLSNYNKFVSVSYESPSCRMPFETPFTLSPVHYFFWQLALTALWPPLVYSLNNKVYVTAQRARKFAPTDLTTKFLMNTFTKSYLHEISTDVQFPLKARSQATCSAFPHRVQMLLRYPRIL